MKIYLTTLFAVALIACQSKNKNLIPATPHIDSCINIKDTFSSISVFTKQNNEFQQNDFAEVINFIQGKGEMKISKKKHEFESGNDIILPHYIDTCNHKYVIQYFIFKNINWSKCFFNSAKPSKGTKDYYPKFSLQQWNFSTNIERDSALKIMKWVYAHGETEYDYRFNQTIVANKKLYLLETPAKLFEEDVIKYAKYINQFISDKK